MRRLLVAAAVLGLLGGAGAAPLKDWRRGVNLEGWLGGGPFRPLDAAQLSQLGQIRAAGFDFVRVPLDPALLIEASASSDEPGRSLDRLLGAARARGLGVLVAVAPDPGLKRKVLLGGMARDTHLVLLERLAARMVAARLPRAMIEPLDEPVDPGRRDCGPSTFDWNAALSAFVRAVRRAAPALPVLVSGICYADADSILDLRPLADRNVVYGFQYLNPLDFTQQGNPSNDDWKRLKGVPYTVNDARAMRRSFEAVGHWSRRYGVPVLLTSFAVHTSAPSAERLRWLRDVRTLAEGQHFAWAAWSWQSPFGFGISGGGKVPARLKQVLGL
ncbi:glycoside hydrolase family 5 protein [Deinococcus hopiensis]|uniref:Cellulase (Glycosyl hydrolase family 5) n=1 Tax=Deinococcus hopiensis KR-140 TaxID=695939 RepID=A0A1W1UEV0_9DEIO|nr:cellulase family glycosylhydrolase [Deinococcus hopiensis]SMB79331.1 Cellulase (glycosyl hydrolase family 5) [Deinococcus hopiensis KR-140]